MAWSPDGTAIGTGTVYEGISLWKAIKPGRFTEVPKALKVSAGENLKWSSDGTLIASGRTVIDVIDASSGSVRHKLPHERTTTAFAWIPDGKLLASGGADNIVRIWDAETGEAKHKFDAHRNPYKAVFGLAWSPDGNKLASASQDSTMTLWNAVTGQIVHRFEGQDGHHGALTWLPDGKTVVLFTDDGKCRLWDATTGQLLKQVDGPKLSGGDFSADKSRLAAKWFNSVEIWDVQAAKSLGTIVMLTDNAWLTCAPEGHFRGSPRVERELVYVVQTEAGQETLTPAEFNKQYGWKNDPEKVKLTD
jgi:WD40 repeat protein